MEDMSAVICRIALAASPSSVGSQAARRPRDRVTLRDERWPRPVHKYPPLGAAVEAVMPVQSRGGEQAVMR